MKGKAPAINLERRNQLGYSEMLIDTGCKRSRGQRDDKGRTIVMQHLGSVNSVEAFDLVVFGGGGDLSMRKLMPALYYRDLDGRLPEQASIFGIGRTPRERESFVAKVRDSCIRRVPTDDFIQDAWERFSNRIHYIALDASTPDGFAELKERLDQNPDRVRVFYLAVSPSIYGSTCTNLHGAGLVNDQARVVLEKPIGHDLASSREICDVVGEIFPEDQLYRIDHYLGKETVQNLLVLRFANSLLEPLWNQKYIDHVQITVAETIGVEGRGSYYDGAGAVRDMLQNHMIQLLCLVAMEPPMDLDPNAVRDEKIKVLRALKPISGDEVAQKTVVGQYRQGAVDGELVASYSEDLEGIVSQTETFVALKAEIGNWRWSGVPFYMRTGKRLNTRLSEIVIQFRKVPHRLFPGEAGAIEPNRLVIVLQPDDGIKLQLMTKVPGAGIGMKSLPLNVSFAEAFKARKPDAYERLLGDVLRGNPTLFMRRDEVDAAWRWVEPMLHSWATNPKGPRSYIAGTWGPSSAIALIERDGRTWHNDAL